MNGYLKAVGRIASASLAEHALALEGEQTHLTRWIRAMNNLRDVERRAEKTPEAKGNVVTLRMDRHAAECGNGEFDALAASRGMADAAVSFILNVLFDSNRSKAEIRIARAMFRPSASLVLIPRDRPSLACAVSVDEFFVAEKAMLQYEDRWEESWRIHDPCTDSGSRMRICAHILLDPKLDAATPRSTEVVFAFRNASTGQRIHSCTIVYDEAPRAISPVTMFA